MYHCLVNLQALIKEAIYLNRIPVIMPPLLHAKHNFGTKLSSNWPKYLNLSKTRVYIRDNDEYKQKLKLFAFILEQDFKQLKFDEAQIYNINPYHEITETENKNYPLIVRSVSSIFWGRWRLAIPEIYKKMRIKFVWSDDVTNISNHIINQLGWYAAIHVRRGDRLNNNKNLKKFTSPKHIFDMMKNIVPSQSNVYILTNEIDKNFFNYLRKHYKIYQYFDFNELTEIISGHEPDNNFLYIIERCIFQNAAIKIGTFKRHNFGFWSGGDYSLSKYSPLQYSTSYKLKQYLAAMLSFPKSFIRRPSSFTSKYITFLFLIREFFSKTRPPQKK
jgi:hypothetical protein